MSHILSQWLNVEVGMSKEISSKDLDSYFSNGYFFGELLHHLRLEDQFQRDYINASSVEAIIKNFTSLETSLRQKLGIKISSNTAYELIHSKQGCAAKMLYQIKSSFHARHHHLSTLKEDQKKSNRENGPKWVRNTPSPLSHSRNESISTSYQQLSDETLPPLLPKLQCENTYRKHFDDMQHQYFVENLRNILKRPCNEVDLTKRNVNGASKIQSVHHFTKLAEAAEASQQTYFASNRKKYPLYDDNTGNLADEPQLVNYAYTDANAAKIEQLYLKRQQNNAIREKELKKKKIEESKKTFLSEIESFESNLEETHLSKDDKSLVSTMGNPDEMNMDDLDPGTIQRFLTVKAPLNPTIHGKTLVSLLPSPELQASQTKEQLERIRKRNIEEFEAKKEREQRRKKIMIAEKKRQEQAEKAKIDTLMQEKLMKLSKQERRIAEQLMQIRHEKEVMRENRSFRNDQYEDRRKKDFEEALSKERVFCLKSMQEYKSQIELQLNQHKEILSEKAKLKRQDNYKLCRELVEQIISLSFKVSEYKELNDNAELPKKLLRQWKTLFLDNQPVTLKYDVALENDNIGGPGLLVVDGRTPNLQDQSGLQDPTTQKDNELSEQAKCVAILDDQEFSEYLAGDGDWGFTGEYSEIFQKTRHKDEFLSGIVNNILEITALPEPPLDIAPLSTVPLRISIIGKPFAGKTALATKLAANYGLQIINVDDLIQLAINEAKDLEGQEADPQMANSAGKLTRAQLGERIQVSLMEGSSPDDQLLVELVVDALKRISPNAASAAALLNGESIQNLASGSNSTDPGWVLLNFPRNRNQAQMLEKVLSGYEDPKPVKLGNLKRTHKNEKGAGQQPGGSGKKRSQIAVENKADPKHPTPQSAIDLVIMLETDNEVSFKRAAGRRMDTLNENAYHLEFEKPPVDQPGTSERLIYPIDDGNESDQLHNQISAFEEQEELLKDWFARFNNMQVIDGTNSMEDVLVKTSEHIKNIIHSKECDKGGKDINTEQPEETPLHSINHLASDESRTNMKDSSYNITTSGEKGGHDALGSSANLKDKPTSGKSRTAAKTQGTPTLVSNTKDKALLVDKKHVSHQIGENITESTNHQLAEIGVLSRATGSDGTKLPSKDLAEVLADQWVLIESNYTDTLKYTFRCLRRESEVILRYFHNTKVNYKNFLERPDSKQPLVELFQSDFNSIEDDLRCDPDAKSELHQRADDLRERLWEMSDIRREEAETERFNVIEDKWVEDHSAILTNIYISMMQAEIDRYIGTRNFTNDYFKDAGAMQLGDTSRHPYKLALLNLTSNPPIDLNSALILSGSTENIQKHRRDINSAGGAIAEISKAPATKNPTQAKTSAPVILAASKKPTTAVLNLKHSINAVALGLPPSTTILNSSEPHTLEDVESMVFTELQNALEQALTVISTAEEVVSPQEKEKKERKKEKVAELLEQKVELDADMPPAYYNIIEYEDQLLKCRLERISQHGMAHLRELRSKGLEVYFLLDEWISLRFQSEMQAIREMLSVIKEAIEAEVKLPNSLVLEGEKFKIDFATLTYEPELEARPESPVEKLMSDQFTILQLINLCRQFQAIAPTGYISVKDFIDAFSRLAALSVGLDILPEIFMNADNLQLKQLTTSLDPYETGFINWQRFLFVSARVLPTPSLEYMISLKSLYRSRSSYSNGKINKSDYMSIPLWFEESLIECAPNEDPKFHRPSKLKNALFYFFSTGTRMTPLAEVVETPNPISEIDGVIMEIEETPTPHDPALVELSEPAAPDAADTIYEESEARNDNIMSEGNDISMLMDLTGDQADSNLKNTTGAGAIFCGEHDKIIDDDNLVFDVDSFLLSCTLEDNARLGLLKGFAILSDKDDYSITANQLYQLLHFWIYKVDETHRTSSEQNAPGPFPLEMILNIFEESGLQENDTITCDVFLQSNEGISLLQSPVFQIDEIRFKK